MSDVNYGLWYDFRNPLRWQQSNEAFYAERLTQIAEAEELGFGSCWLTEHHFCEDGYTPSPLVLAAAIAARTKQMRLGTNLMLLPLHDPVRVAEDVATLSLTSGGRFDLGVGIGYRQLEFDHFGRKLSHRPSLVEEGIEILRRSWSGKPINFSGKRFEVGDLAVTPVPQTVPKVYLGGMVEPAIQRAARVADGFLCTGGIGIDIYNEALLQQGKALDDGDIILGCWAIIAEDPEAEAAKIGDHILYQINEYIKWGAFGPPDATPLFDDVKSAIENGLYELWDADTAVKELNKLMTTYPNIRDIHFWAQFPGESVESGNARLRYIAEKVLPRLG
ncbi:Luciferase-like monooxygenase superfamily protein [marine gamma proteobacterium HTCC2148]|jgi:alkanesulfonate monooxygenase SsuD/methylene tetrahydromethanopterin reductase-like flavin-dependent oxidoreductase (luciferase family)|nr:Luciferase-like monooxygenase superfamily protein [marine gamma proteobacterium HTCC2148]MBT5007139.1 LLM class flavin-dependent oxidoreductase [Halieaceae bacterium]MBT6125494.1 LLM class flavin-dependent oxidoreductase [Halieaceae bacterium]MBT7719726.1 LLM class flavin-dependent oxidoreductase [Halieaceae bacterium]